MVNAFGLARVSTKEQEDGHTIPAQVQRINEYALKKSFSLEKVYELTESSSVVDRKKFHDLLDAIRKSKGMVALLVETVDRLQRSFRESVELDVLRKEGKLEIHFLRESLVISKDSNSSDIMRWDLGVFVAKTYVLQLGDNVKRSIEQKLRNGEWAGKAPIGYKNVDLENGAKSIIHDPERAHLVKLIFEHYSTGNYSMSHVAKMLREQGLVSNTPNHTPMSKSVVEAIIKNPFYYGEMKWKDKLYPHRYEPLIPRWLFDKCQAVREGFNKKPFRYAAKFFSLRGLIKHDCGSMLSPYEQKGIVYLKCTRHRNNCAGVHLTEDKLLKQLGTVFALMVPPDDVVEDVKMKLKESSRVERKFYEDNLQRINSQLERIRARLKIAYEDRLDGRITTDEYDKYLQESKQKERDLLLQLEDHSRADEQFLISTFFILDLVKRAGELFMRSKPEQKRRYLNFVASNLVLEGENLIYKLEDLFAALVEMGKTQIWLPRLDSNQ